MRIAQPSATITLDAILKPMQIVYPNSQLTLVSDTYTPTAFPSARVYALDRET